ncbi:MAG TPA: hypothetical protein VHT96_11230 [Clostridia bacterium]|nr:hypothetical protein [Clostridia bacterium]
MKNLYQIIHIVGAVQGIFLFLLLVMRKENKTANKILAFLILLVSINLTASFFHTNNDLIMDLPAINRSDAFIFIYGPLLAGYAMFLTGYRRKVTLLQVLQLIPGLCLLFLLLVNRYDIGGLALQSLWDESEPVALRLWFVIHFGALLDMLLYAAYGLNLVYRYDSKLKTFFSNAGRIYLHWLRILLVSIVFICFAALVQFLVFGFGNTEGPLQWVISTATVILVFVIGYYTNRQPDILKDLGFITPGLSITPVAVEPPRPPSPARDCPFSRKSPNRLPRQSMRGTDLVKSMKKAFSIS